jgi:hypothetical protein
VKLRYRQPGAAQPAPQNKLTDARSFPTLRRGGDPEAAMTLTRRATVLGMIASLLLLSSCGGGKSAPTAPPASATPPDPNAGLYGDWQGGLDMTFPGGRTQDAITLYVTSGGMACWVNWTKYPVASYTLADPNITVNVTLPGGVLTLTGTRSSETLEGNAYMPAQSGTGIWAVTKIGGSPPAVSASGRLGKY